MMGIIWLGILVVMLIIEFITLGLTTIWFAGGALVAFIAVLLGAGLPLQIILFFVVSILLLAGTRPFAVKYINKDRTRTNAESLVGSTGIVVEEINNLKATGKVAINGQEWTARSSKDMAIPKDAVVRIQEISGVKLIVTQTGE